MGTTVETVQGKLRGRQEDGLHVFRGVPFAAPPVEDLRFRAPQPQNEDCLFLNVWTPGPDDAARIGVALCRYLGLEPDDQRRFADDRR